MKWQLFLSRCPGPTTSTNGVRPATGIFLPPSPPAMFLAVFRVLTIWMNTALGKTLLTTAPSGTPRASWWVGFHTGLAAGFGWGHGDGLGSKMSLGDFASSTTVDGCTSEFAGDGCPVQSFLCQFMRRLSSHSWVAQASQSPSAADLSA
jgi:hypothetical protein